MKTPIRVKVESTYEEDGRPSRYVVDVAFATNRIPAFRGLVGFNGLIDNSGLKEALGRVLRLPNSLSWSDPYSNKVSPGQESLSVIEAAGLLPSGTRFNVRMNSRGNYTLVIIEPFYTPVT